MIAVDVAGCKSAVLIVHSLVDTGQAPIHGHVTFS